MIKIYPIIDISTVKGLRTCDPEFISHQDGNFTLEDFASQKEQADRQTEAAGQTDVMSVCTFLPQLAETPVEQSQDKAHEYGLDRLQYGWLEGEEGRDKKKSASKSTKTNMEDGAATAREEEQQKTGLEKCSHV